MKSQAVTQAGRSGAPHRSSSTLGTRRDLVSVTRFPAVPVPADVREICRELDLKNSVAAAGADLVTGFHHVVWMGDLNYRLDYGQQVCA